MISAVSRSNGVLRGSLWRHDKQVPIRPASPALFRDTKTDIVASTAAYARSPFSWRSRLTANIWSITHFDDRVKWLILVQTQ